MLISELIFIVNDSYHPLLFLNNAVTQLRHVHTLGYWGTPRFLGTGGSGDFVLV